MVEMAAAQAAASEMQAAAVAAAVAEGEAAVAAIRDELLLSQSMLMTAESNGREEGEATAAATVAALRTEVFELAREADALRAERTKAEAEVVTVGKTVVELREQVAMMHKELIALSDAAEAAEASKAEAERLLSVRNDEVADKVAELETASQLMDQLRERLGGTVAKSREMESALRDVDHERTALRQRAAELDAKLAEERASATCPSAREEALAAELIQTKKALASRLQQLGEARSKVVRLSKRVSDGEAAATAREAHLESSVSALSHERDRLASACAESARKMASLQARIDELEVVVGSGQLASSARMSEQLRAEAEARQAAEAALDSAQAELAHVQAEAREARELRREVALREEQLQRATALLNASRSPSPVQRVRTGDRHGHGVSTDDEKRLVLSYARYQDTLADGLVGDGSESVALMVRRLHELGWTRPQLEVVHALAADAGMLGDADSPSRPRESTPPRPHPHPTPERAW